jgi:hypothetical protein
MMDDFHYPYYNHDNHEKNQKHEKNKEKWQYKYSTGLYARALMFLLAQIAREPLSVLGHVAESKDGFKEDAVAKLCLGHPLCTQNMRPFAFLRLYVCE